VTDDVGADGALSGFASWIELHPKTRPGMSKEYTAASSASKDISEIQNIVVSKAAISKSQHRLLDRTRFNNFLWSLHRMFRIVSV